MLNRYGPWKPYLIATAVSVVAGYAVVAVVEGLLDVSHGWSALFGAVTAIMVFVVVYRVVYRAR